MKLRDYIALAAYMLPMLAGCVGVVVGGYWLLCSAPLWMESLTAFTSDAFCAVLCGVIGGAVLAVCVMLGAKSGGRRTIRNREARCLGYVSADSVCRVFKK